MHAAQMLVKGVPLSIGSSFSHAGAICYTLDIFP